jgi:hypothetical protein
MIAGSTDAAAGRTATVHGFLRSVARAFTWKRFLWVQSLALVYSLVWALGVGADAPPHRLIGQFVNTALNATLIMFATLCADEAVERGAPARRAYLSAFLIVLAASGTLQWYLRDWFGIRVPPNSLSPLEEQMLNMVVTALDVGIVGGIAMLAYLNRRTANRMLDGVRRVELQRLQRERELIESRITAAAAQMNPQQFFSALDDIKARYESGAPDAESRLDELIHRLRGALARTVAAGGPEATQP